MSGLIGETGTLGAGVEELDQGGRVPSFKGAGCCRGSLGRPASCRTVWLNSRCIVPVVVGQTSTKPSIRILRLSPSRTAYVGRRTGRVWPGGGSGYRLCSCMILPAEAPRCEVAYALRPLPRRSCKRVAVDLPCATILCLRVFSPSFGPSCVLRALVLSILLMLLLLLLLPVLSPTKDDEAR